MNFLFLTFLFASFFIGSEAACAASPPEESLKCTVLNVALTENGGSSVSTVDGSDIDTPYLIDGDMSEPTSSDPHPSHDVKITFARPFYINSVWITELDIGDEAETVNLKFSDGTSYQIILSGYTTVAEEFFFPPRSVSWVQVLVTSSQGGGQVYFSEIEFYFDGCHEDMICNHVELNPTNDSMPYFPVSSFLAFLKYNEEKMAVEIASHNISLSFTVLVEDKVTLLDSDSKVIAGPSTIDGGISHPTPFWVDHSNPEKLVVGIGATVLIDHSTGTSTPLAQARFVLPSSNPVAQEVTVCRQNAYCYSHATHYLPLDKIVSKATYDVNYAEQAAAQGVATRDSHGPPMMSSERLAVHLNRGSIDLSYASGCIADLSLCINGISFALWLKIHSLPSTEGYYLAGGTVTNGFALMTPFQEDRMEADNVLEALFQTENIQWRISLPAVVGEWHQIGCGWSEAEGATCVLDQYTTIRGVQGAPVDSFAGVMIGQSGSIPDSFVDASFSNLALWESRLTVAHFQDLYSCTGFKPAHSNAPSEMTFSDDSFTASSFTTDGPPSHARPNAGGWQAEHDNTQQYFQLDMFALREVSALEMMGNAALDTYVKTFTLSISDSGRIWNNYEDPVGTSKVFDANTDSSTAVKIDLDPPIKSRFIRVHPLSSHDGISFTLGIFGTETDANYEACLPANDVISLLNFFQSDTIPNDCNTLCGRYGKTHALVYKGGDCYCSSTVSTTPSLSNSFCQSPCKEKSKLKCGGPDTVASYAVTDSSTKSLEIFAPLWTKEDEAFNLTMTSSQSSTIYRLFSNEYVISTQQNIFQLSYARSGPKKLTVEARLGEDDPQSSLAEIDVLVAPTAQSLNLSCPVLQTEIGRRFVCTLEGYTGSGDIFKLKVGETAPETTVSLPANILGSVGTSHDPTTQVDTPRTGLYFLNSFSETGIISSVQAHAQKSGFISVQIYRSVCGTGPWREYCNRHRKCTYFNIICAEEVNQHKCDVDDLLNLPTGKCQETEGRIAEASTTGFMPAKYRTYELIYEHKLFAGFGLNDHHLEEHERVRVRKDDIMAVTYPEEGAATLSVEKIDGYEAEIEPIYLDEFPTGDFIGMSAATSRKVNLRHSIRLRYFVPQIYTFDFDFAPGVHHITAGLENHITSIQLAQTVTSSQAIAGLTWATGSIIATHDEYTVTGQYTQGINVSLAVDWGDGTVREVFQEQPGSPVIFKHRYSDPGYKILEIRATNILSDEVHFYTLLVQDYIKDVNLTTPVTPTNHTNVTEIPWYIDSGSRVTIEYDLGDGTKYIDQHLDIDGKQTDIRNIDHIYPDPVEYWVNITAYNLVNRIQLYFMLIVEKPIVGLVSRVIHANRDIEVNETVVIELTQVTGTNVIHYFQFQDATTLLTRETSINKYYWYWDFFHVNITAWNNVSRLIWTQDIKVHKPVRVLTGFVITTSPTNHTDPVRFDFNMTTGSDFNCTWTFDDGLFGASNYWILDSEVYKWPITQQAIYHKYADIGVYHVDIHCENRLYNTQASTISIVQVPIYKFFVNKLPAQPNDEDLVVDFGAQTGTNISYTVTFYHIWDKIDIPITNVTISPDTLIGRAVVPKHLFTDRVAFYEVRVTAINLVTPLNTIVQRVIVDRPIRASYIKIHALFVETNHTVKYTIYSDASNVTITWDFDDPSSLDENIHTNWFQGVFPLDGWHRWHKFKKNGFYTLKVVLNNSLCTVPVTKEVIGQHGVYLDVTTDSPRPLPPGRLNFTFTPFPKKRHPTDANMTVHFGDGRLYTGFYMPTVIHFYEGWGFFTINVTIWNEIDWGFFEFQIEIQRTIQGMKLTPFHSAGDAGFFAPALGVNFDNLPLEYDVIWNVTIHDGTNVTYTFSFGDGTTLVTMNATVLHKYSAVDYYTATVHAENSVSSGTTTFRVRMQQIVRGLHVKSDCPRKLHDTTTFTITIDQIGTESCYLMKLGNNSDNILFKEFADTLCEQKFLDLATETRVLPGHEFNFTYVYGFIDVYYPRFIGSNYVSKTWKFHKAVVVHDHCRYPVVNIFNIGKTVDTSTGILRSQTFVIDTLNTIDCAASEVTSFNWQVFSVNPDESQNDTLYNLPDVFTTHYARLRVPLRTLPYGKYKARFTITHLGIRGVLKFDEAYFAITESVLIPGVKGGTGYTINLPSNRIIDASISHDPDVGEGKYEGMEMKWECEVSTHPPGVTEEEAGCGIDRYIVLADGNASDLIYMNTTFAKMVDSTYSLKVCLKKMHRRACTYFSVYTKPVTQLNVVTICKDNCKKKRISGNKCVYSGGVEGMTDPKQLAQCTVLWELFKARETHSLGRVQESSWSKVLDFADMAYTPLTEILLSIKEKVLLSEYRYRLRLSLWCNDTQGFAEEELFMNQPPSGGNCSIKPPVGCAVETKFTVRCDGWGDEDTPLSYSFALQTEADGLEKVFYFGSKSVAPPIILPVGNTEQNYTIKVIIKPADVLKAATMEILHVTVEPCSCDNICELKHYLAQNGSLGNLMASGDSHGAIQLINAVSSLLEVCNETSPVVVDELAELDVLEIAKLKPEEVQAMKDRLKASQEEAMAIIEAQRTCKKNMRDTMNRAASDCPIDSIEATHEMTSGTASTTNTPSETTETSQKLALEIACNVVEFLFNAFLANETFNMDDLVQTCRGVIFTAGNTIESSAADTAAKLSANVTSEDDELENGNSTSPNNASQSITDKGFECVDRCSQILAKCKFAGEPPTEVNSNRLSMTVERRDASKIGDAPATSGGGEVAMPDAGTVFNIDGNDTSGTTVDSKLLCNSDNPFTGDATSSRVQSKVITMEFKNATGHQIKISNLSKPIDMWVPRPTVVNFTKYTCVHKKFLYRAFTVVENDTSIQIEIIPEDNNTEIIAYIRFEVFPTEEDYDYKFLVPPGITPVEEGANFTSNRTTNKREKNPYIFFISNEDLNRTASGKYYVGIRCNGTYEPVFEPKIVKNKVTYVEYVPPEFNFTLRTFTSACMYWNVDHNTWKTDGCTVGKLTCMEGTQCLCTHLTSFGGDMVVAPNTIDWSAVSLDNLLSNPAVFAVVMSFIFVYLLLLIPARRADKKDKEKLGVVPLADNDPRDNYAYEITVYTGFSAEAGTTANVYFVLKGTLDETPVRFLKDPNKEKFSSVGSINYFLLTVPSSLGKLKSVRIWHDNGGESPSWYLLRLMIHDMQRDTKTWFLCDRWLAVEEDDGEVERNLHVAKPEDLTRFNLLFQTEARRNLSDGHIWFSVIRRPARSNFTRVQRLSCCLCILLTTMLANAMFYQKDPSTEGDGVLVIGPITLSLQQLSIAITSSMVVLPVNLFVVWIFRNARPQTPKKSRSAAHREAKQEKATGGGKRDKKGKKSGAKKGSLPHYMVYVAYVLILIACLVSAAFTVFYGLTFGKAKSEAWITAMMISFWQDVLVSQPLKVFAAATFFAMITRDPKKATGQDEEDLPSPELQDDEEFTTQRSSNVKPNFMAGMDNPVPHPPDPVKLQADREVRLKKKQMKYIIYDIIWYFIFVCVLLSVAYGNKDATAYDTTSTMSSMFEDSSYTGWISMAEVNDPKLFWYWARYSLLPTLIPNQWYGPNLLLENVVWVTSDSQISRSRGARSRMQVSSQRMLKLQSRPGEFPDVQFALNGTTGYPENYVADRATDYTVGVARFRQLRVKPKQCVVHPVFRHIFNECNSYYSWEKEDEGMYYEGWKPENKTTPDNTTEDEEPTEEQKNAWQYNTAWDLKGTPYWAGFSTYWGGGFVADMGHNETLALNMSKYLQDNGWLDRYTRAIFIEFTVYNPSVNMFCVVTLLTEIIPTGGYYQFNQIYPMRLYRYFGDNLLAIMILEITLMTFLVYFLYREFKRWRREGRQYWREFWTYMELLVLGSCFSTVGLYFARMVATRYSMGLMREDPHQYVSFHYAASLDEWATFTLGMAVFLSFIKTLRLLRFNRRLSVMGTSIRACATPLASFSIVYGLVFLAYATLGYFVFGRVSADYHTFHSAMANVLGMTLGAFNFHALVEANALLGPIFFFTFTFVVNFILINVFVAIICESLARVTSDVTNQSKEHEMMDFMWHQFKLFIGQRVSPAIKPIYKEPLPELEAKFDNIEKKSEKAELALRNMCMEEIRHARWFNVENCSNKKKLLLRLLLHARDDMTESDLCDAIPLLDEMMYAYSEKDMKEWLGEYEEFDDGKSCRSSILFSRRSLRDSDDSDSDPFDSDAQSDTESMLEAKWVKLSEDHATTSARPGDSGLIRSDSFTSIDSECYYHESERPPTTGELEFSHEDTTIISVTSLHDNVATAELRQRAGSTSSQGSLGSEYQASYRRASTSSPGNRASTSSLDDRASSSSFGDRASTSLLSDRASTSPLGDRASTSSLTDRASTSPFGDRAGSHIDRASISPRADHASSSPRTPSSTGTPQFLGQREHRS